MEYIHLIMVIVVLALDLPSGTGLLFRLSQNNIDIANPRNNSVNLTCSMTHDQMGFKPRYIKIYKNSNSGSSWEQIAGIYAENNASLVPSLPDNWRSMLQASGRFVKNNATNNQLVVSMNASMITCLQARKYHCHLRYDLFEVTAHDEADDVTFQVTASPSTPYIETVKNLNTGQVINVAQGDTTALSIQEGEQLEIVCKANIGTDQNTTILWTYNSSSGREVIGYNGDPGNGDAQVDTSGGPATNCTYTRNSTMRYNTSDLDSARSSSNPLTFSCYIESGGTLTQNNPMYSVTIGSSNVGAIVGGVVGGLALIVIVTLLVYFLWYRRRSTGGNLLKQSEPVEQRDTRMTFKKAENQIYTNMYDSIRDTYVDCASAKEGGNAINDKDGNSRKPVSDTGGFTATKNEHGYLSFRRTETENQADIPGTDPSEFNTNEASMVGTNAENNYLTPVSTKPSNNHQ